MGKPSEVAVDLESPIDFGEERIEKIVIKRPKAKHFKNLGGEPKLGDLLAIAAKCSGQPPSLFDEMDMSDAMKVIGVINSFLPDGQEIG